MKEKSTARPARIPYLRVAGTLLSVAALGYLLFSRWNDIVTAIADISWPRLLLAFVLMVISRLAVTCRWHVLLRSAGVPVTLGQSTRITFAGLFANNVLPTTIGGDMVRLGGGIRFGFDQAVVVASLVVDRLVGMAGMAMVLPFGLQAFSANAGASAVGAGLVSTQAGLPSRLWAKGKHVVERLLKSLSLWIAHPQGLLAALVFTWIHMLCIFSMFWLLLDDMGQTVPFLLIAGLESVSYFVTLLPFSVNGLGFQEVSIALLFSIYGGASQESGAVLALLYRTLMMLVSLPGALFIPSMIAGDKTNPAQPG